MIAGVPSLLVAALPLSIIVAPLLLVPVIIAGLALRAAHLLPEAAAQWLFEPAHLLTDAFFLVARGEHHGELIAWPLLLMVPGCIVLLVGWAVLLLGYRKAWSNAFLNELGGRPADPAQREHRMLLNLVEELAVSAAIPPPRVMIKEDSSCNAVAVGSGHEDFAIVVTSGLIERLSRDEIQAIVAQLVASAGNGDLRIASTLFMMFSAWGLAGLLIDWPMSPDARSGLAEFGHSIWNRLRGRADEDLDKAAIRALLVGTEIEAITAQIPLEPRYGMLREIFLETPVQAFVGWTGLTYRVAIALMTSQLVGPRFARHWRSRRLLADAAAAQLTRQPQCLAAALGKMRAANMVVPDGHKVFFLFADWSLREKIDAAHTDIANQMPGLLDGADERQTRLQRLGSNHEFERQVRDWAWFRNQLRWKMKSIAAVAFLLPFLGFMTALGLAMTGGLVLLVWVAAQRLFGIG